MMRASDHLNLEPTLEPTDIRKYVSLLQPRPGGTWCATTHLSLFSMVRL